MVRVQQGDSAPAISTDMHSDGLNKPPSRNESKHAFTGSRFGTRCAADFGPDRDEPRLEDRAF